MSKLHSICHICVNGLPAMLFRRFEQGGQDRKCAVLIISSYHLNFFSR